MTILIIEDDEGLTELIKEKVEESGYETTSVTSAGKALEWLVGHTPYIMLVDYSLPDMNAKEFITELQKKQNPLPPFIVSTGQGDERIAVTMMKLGAMDYIVKDSLFLDILPEVIRRADREIENENKRKRAEDALRESEERYRSILNASPIDITITDLEGRILMVSPMALSMFGCKRDNEMVGHVVFDFIVPDDRDRVATTIALMFQDTISGLSEYRGLRMDGSSFDIEVNSEFIRDLQRQPTHIVFIVRDITERNCAKEKINALLAEKELILKEVHHRIKNNMNTIEGLLHLQASTLKDPSAIAALNDAESRVHSMMVLYDKLYLSVSFNDVSIKDYFSALVDQIIGNFPNSTLVKIEKHVDDFMIDAKRLSSLGIIINELLTNIMKYAFTGRSAGLITVSASLKGNRVYFIIADNGNGMPKSIDFENSTGFGLKLVEMLTRQIGGSIRIERENGTRIILEFEKLDFANQSPE